MVYFPELSRSLRLIDLEDASARRASFLRAQDLPPGEVVGVLASHRPEFLVDLFGVLRAGCAALILPFTPGAQHYQAGLRAIVDALDTAGAKTVVTDKGLAGVGERLAELCPTIRLVGPGRTAEREPLPQVFHTQPALVYFPPGAVEGRAGIALTHGQVVAGIRAVRWSAGIGLEDVLVQWLPLHDPLGLFGLLSQVFVGGRVHVFPPRACGAAAEGVLRYVGESRATVTLGRAAGYARLREAAEAGATGRLDLARWRVALVGGGLTPPELTRFCAAFASYGVRAATATPLYHVAEAAFAVTCKQPDTDPTVAAVDETALRERGKVRHVHEEKGEGTARILSSGHPVVGMRVRTVGPDGAPAPAHVVGDIEISGGAVMSGYHRDLRSTLRSVRNGWFRTGDRGFLWNGELFVTEPAERVVGEQRG
ncbi:AMP-binding protein [Prauserella shujinwangii]|nr:AMP-binding protein [Prauserella shujinwangii]